MWQARCAACPWRGDAGERDIAEEQAFRHEVVHWLEESCRAQGVPLHVSDPTVLKRIAVLLLAGTTKEPPAAR